MTRKHRNHLLSVVAAITVVIVIIALSAIAQNPASQSLGKMYSAPAAQHGDSSRLAAGEADRSPASRPRTGGYLAGPKDENSLQFLPVVTYDSDGRGPVSVAVGDVNRDGKLDLVAGNGDSSSEGWLGVLLGNGDGSFQPAVTYDAGGLGATSVTIADFNGDGRRDLAETIANVPGCMSGVGVLLGNGDGTFQPPIIACFPAWGGGAATAVSMNQDDKTDLLLLDGVTRPLSGCYSGAVTEASHLGRGISPAGGNPVR